MLLKAYFDGSGSFSRKAQSGILTLGGYAGSEEAWGRFNEAWVHTLRAYGVGYFSATDADAGHGEFKGWNPHRVSQLRAELLCIRRDHFKSEDRPIYSISCSIDIGDYRRAERERHDLPNLPAFLAERCVRNCFKLADGQLHLYFDRREKFHVQLYRLWQSPKSTRRYPWLNVIRKFAVALDSRDYPGLQAADHLAWTMYRQLTAKDQGFQLQMLEGCGEHANEFFEFSDIVNYKSVLES